MTNAIDKLPKKNLQKLTLCNPRSAVHFYSSQHWLGYDQFQLGLEIPEYAP